MYMNLMTQGSDLILNVAIGSIYLELLDQGFRVEQSHDFDEFKKICGERDNRPVSAHADLDLFDFSEGNGFFLIVYDEQNKVVATIAAKFDSLKRTNLAQFWQQRLPRLYGGSIRAIRSPAAFDITGKVVYLGDMWVQSGNPARGLGFLLPRLSLLYSLSKFDPDFCYALHQPRMAERRSIEIGFSHCQRRAIDWEQLPEDFNDDFWISYSRSDDLHHLAYSIVEKIHRNKEASQKT